MEFDLGLEKIWDIKLALHPAVRASVAAYSQKVTKSQGTRKAH